MLAATETNHLAARPGLNTALEIIPAIFSFRKLQIYRSADRDFTLPHKLSFNHFCDDIDL